MKHVDENSFFNAPNYYFRFVSQGIEYFTANEKL